MKIHTTNPATRTIGIKVDGKKPRDWKEGDPVPQIQHSAAFDGNGNAEVQDATGKLLISRFTSIKEGHKQIAPESKEE